MVMAFTPDGGEVMALVYVGGSTSVLWWRRRLEYGGGGKSSDGSLVVICSSALPSTLKEFADDESELTLLFLA
jgi:hypothetical protein